MRFKSIRPECELEKLWAPDTAAFDALVTSGEVAGKEDIPEPVAIVDERAPNQFVRVVRIMSGAPSGRPSPARR